MTARANKILGSLKKAFECRDSGLWKNLYTSLVRSHEYAVQVRSLTREMDKSSIEKVQDRATEIPASMINIEYETRHKNGVLIG